MSANFVWYLSFPPLVAAQIAACCIVSGIDELWTVDRVFTPLPPAPLPQPPEHVKIAPR
ncbi:MAG: hypothetical protein ISS73_01390 [Pirellulales bacterium]|nr:hypothetical protein [Pirellulales bacterium]